MDVQQLHETIEQQNQLILAKDEYIKELQYKLEKTSNKLYDLEWDVSWQRYNNKWATEAIRQKAVEVIGGFEYNTRYISLETTALSVLGGIAITVFLLHCVR